MERLLTVCASTLVILVGFLCATIPARAQRGATDNELYAGYCFGVMDWRVGLDNPNGEQHERPHNDELEKLLGIGRSDNTKAERVYRDAMEKRQRFLSYMLSTGGFLSARGGGAALGVLLAINQGHSDGDRCLRALDDRNCKLPQCPNSGPTPDDAFILRPRPQSDEENACRAKRMDACLALEPACARQKRCDEADNLPF